MSYNIKKILLLNADHAKKIQLESGEFHKDHNGPWFDNVTPLRVTSHWAILLLNAFIMTGDHSYKDCAIKALEFCSKEKNRPNGKIFRCRVEKNKSQSNGLVGQAWVCEALVEGYRILGIEKYLRIAYDNITAHKFDEKYCLWNETDVCENDSRLNRTLNQQIIFTAVAGEVASLKEDINLTFKCESFWSKILDYTHWMCKGVPFHKVKLNDKNTINSAVLRQFLDRKSWKEESFGYLSFVLYGISLEYIYNGKNIFFKSEKFINFIREIFSNIDNNLFERMYSKENRFSWAYNPTGIEVSIAINCFSHLLNTNVKCDPWLDKQFTCHLDSNYLLTKNTLDEVILSSRIYELVRLN